MTVKPRIRVPDEAKVGEVIEIRSLVNHIMETGQRRDATGKMIPRNIIHTFTASYSGRIFFTARLQPATSSNPFLAFHLKVPGPGSFEFTWEDDTGGKITETVPLRVVTA
jgi:sulfur-oxidizing protein SoxZ